MAEVNQEDKQHVPKSLSDWSTRDAAKAEGKLSVSQLALRNTIRSMPNLRKPTAL